MLGRILKTIIATTLAGIMLASGSGCGSNHPTTTASSTSPVDVIKQIEEDCGIRSQRPFGFLKERTEVGITSEEPHIKLLLSSVPSCRFAFFPPCEHFPVLFVIADQQQISGVGVLAA